MEQHPFRTNLSCIMLLAGSIGSFCLLWFALADVGLASARLPSQHLRVSASLGSMAVFVMVVPVLAILSIRLGKHIARAFAALAAVTMVLLAWAVLAWAAERGRREEEETKAFLEQLILPALLEANRKVESNQTARSATPIP